VVIFDPNWNPAHDLQAQDRSFRYGQKRHVLVFCLLAAGSLEELFILSKCTSSSFPTLPFLEKWKRDTLRECR